MGFSLSSLYKIPKENSKEYEILVSFEGRPSSPPLSLFMFNQHVFNFTAFALIVESILITVITILIDDQETGG